MGLFYLYILRLSRRMNRKSIFIMLVIAFALIWQTYNGEKPIPEIFTEEGDNVQNFFDALEPQMNAAGYNKQDFYAAARAALDGFKNGGYFEIFTQSTDQGFQQAYNFVSGNPQQFGFEQGEFTANAGIFQQFFSFIQTCFASFSQMSPVAQMNALLQFSGFYICIKKLYDTATGICRGAYNLSKMTITTFKALYNGLTATADTTGENPNLIPISINIPSAQPTVFASVPQVASPRTIGEVKLALDSIMSTLEKEGKQIDENTTLEQIMILEGSMSAADADMLAKNTRGLDISDFNFQRTSSEPIGAVSPFVQTIERSNSMPDKFNPKIVPKLKGHKIDVFPYGKKGGKSKRRTTKRRKQSKKKTKRRKSTYKRRRSSSRKR